MRLRRRSLQYWVWIIAQYKFQICKNTVYLMLWGFFRLKLWVKIPFCRFYITGISIYKLGFYIWAGLCCFCVANVWYLGKEHHHCKWMHTMSFLCFYSWPWEASRGPSMSERVFWTAGWIYYCNNRPPKGCCDQHDHKGGQGSRKD